MQREKRITWRNLSNILHDDIQHRLRFYSSDTSIACRAVEQCHTQFFAEAEFFNPANRATSHKNYGKQEFEY